MLIVGNLLQFLWPFQSFSNAKGRNFLMQNGMKFGIDLDMLENDDPVGNFNQLRMSQDDAENVTVLGSGPRDNVKFEWMITPWSECSQSCGPEIGYKVIESLLQRWQNHKSKMCERC